MILLIAITKARGKSRKINLKKYCPNNFFHLGKLKLSKKKLFNKLFKIKIIFYIIFIKHYHNNRTEIFHLTNKYVIFF